MNNPAQTVIEKFGGDIAKIAGICRVHVSRVHRWTYPKEKGGTDGIIPPKRQDLLLAAAPREGVDLRRDDFFPAIAEQPSAPQKGGLKPQPIRLSPASNASKDISLSLGKSGKVDKRVGAR